MMMMMVLISDRLVEMALYTLLTSSLSDASMVWQHHCERVRRKTAPGSV